ncbi:hypothetical protein ADUPG1_014015, partial [Aduncisulcus paluster]
MPRQTNPFGLPTDIIECSCGKKWDGLSNYSSHRRRTRCMPTKIIFTKFKASTDEIIFGFNKAHKFLNANVSQHICFLGAMRHRDISSAPASMLSFIRENRSSMCFSYDDRDETIGKTFRKTGSVGIELTPSPSDQPPQDPQPPVHQHSRSSTSDQLVTSRGHGSSTTLGHSSAHQLSPSSTSDQPVTSRGHGSSTTLGHSSAHQLSPSSTSDQLVTSRGHGSSTTLGHSSAHQLSPSSTSDQLVTSRGHGSSTTLGHSSAHQLSPSSTSDQPVTSRGHGSSTTLGHSSA